MVSKPSKHYMDRAIDEAHKAVGRTSPNPPVGAVIVRDGYIVAKGHTFPPGQAHAEINALKAWDGQRPEDCTLYVTLEPCCFHGRTPPCTDAIIRSKIPRVVVGLQDPNPHVCGKGIKVLTSHDVQVVDYPDDPALIELIAPFTKRIHQGLPYLAVKWAMTLDGRIATKTGDSQWISSPAARQEVHKLRNSFDAILIGAQTAIHDNPRLTTRIENGRDAVRVVLDSKLSTPKDSNLLNHKSIAPTFIFTRASSIEQHTDWIKTFDPLKVDFIPVQTMNNGLLDLTQVLRILCDRGINSVLCEGGAETIASLFEHHLVDRVYTFIAPKIVGGTNALPPVKGSGVDLIQDSIQLHPVSTHTYGDDTLIICDVNPSSQE